jgi:hypothetical protein
MDTNTVSDNKTATTTVVTEVKAVKTPKTPGKLGRKATPINELAGKRFTIEDLVNANPTVKPPTIRAFVARSVAAGRYEVVGKDHNGGRGKPANIYFNKA